MIGPFIDLGPRRRVLASLIDGYEILDAEEPRPAIGLKGFPRRLTVAVRGAGAVALYDEAMDAAIEQLIAVGIAPQSLRAEKYLPEAVVLAPRAAGRSES